MPKGINHKPPVDWAKIERQYRANLLSVSEIAREHGMVEGNIRYRAKKEGWQRDLAAHVRNRSNRKQYENMAQVFKEGEERIKDLQDDQIIEEAARTQVEVVRQHQRLLKSGHGLTLRMLDELDATTCLQGELTKLIMETKSPEKHKAALRAISLNSRATVLRDLATAARQWVTLERQAFNISDDRDKEKPQVEDKTAEQLRQEILEEAKEIGLDLTTLDQGLGRAGNGKIH